MAWNLNSFPGSTSPPRIWPLATFTSCYSFPCPHGPLFVPWAYQALFCHRALLYHPLYPSCYHISQFTPFKAHTVFVFTSSGGESHWFYSTTYTQGYRQHLSKYSVKIKIEPTGKSLVVQWLGLCAFTTMSPGSVPDQGTKILQGHMVWLKETKTK